MYGERDVRAVDKALAFVCAVTAVFALSFAAGRIVGPVDPDVTPSSPTQEHDGGH
ncbi:hypothetical protein ISU10_13725 [Nocardioides agariphilus]|jgi:hypothetical protein|uniref:Uncharacterized protein n=1 Tax=Nocardioides agariphilus TaxID=433664 RepID=A0A930VRY0_9ACTN|nr:hypothetical protein [Nocardioides agariphilus]MBF4768820.1 hypothetical protein [Nocardioides agariphilus]